MKARIVAIYARVSTEHEAQLSALENQVQYYDNLLQLHPEWKLYKTYIDEGITGTSVKKRKNFMQMMEDAENGCFDLIITREVSRFARNTVDTLQQTRLLKKYGVEVYFTEDNIWTMNDEDGELRLTIMATLAQNESKKTSIRVKAGQMVSFQNGVAYGNGNILGYDRQGKGYVINQEQAKTVRMIYDMYLDGMGMRKIQFELEKAGRLTATGLTNWSCANIGRILNNPFYSGTVVYRKQFVPDYLEQKKINNFDYVDKVVVEGTHEPIITKEEFEQVQKILSTKSASVGNKGARGRHVSNDVWCKKLKCSCGSSFNRRVWRRVSGIPQYAYQCYKQISTGTVRTRLNKGLSIEGTCRAPMVPGWKLGAMADIIFQKFWKDREGVIAIANEMLEKHIMDDRDLDFSDEIQDIQKKIDIVNKKFDNLVDMRMAGEIDKAMYNEKKQSLDDERERLTNLLASYQIEEKVSDEDYSKKLEILKYGLEQNFNFETHSIPEEVIDAFVDQIIVYEDCFVWKLNMFDDTIKMNVEGRKNNPTISLVESPNIDNGSTGSYRAIGRCAGSYRK
jgi:DNA invertase Pin-like site-specific DNA recombinase